MRVTFICPECDGVGHFDSADDDSEIVCHSCSWRRSVDSPTDAAGLSQCLVCGCHELFIRKNFPQRLGVAIVIAGMIGCTIAWAYHMRYTWYGILFAMALADVILYFTVGNLLQCYRCRAEYRGLEALDTHDAFSLETHERYRQEAARLAEEEQRSGAMDQGSEAGGQQSAVSSPESGA